MMITASWMEREVTVDVSWAGQPLRFGPAQLRPPSVREAIGVLDACESLDDDGWHVLTSVLRSWMPVRLWSQLTTALSRRACAEVAVHLLSVGVPDVKAHSEKQAKAQEVAGEVGWSRLVAEYRHTLGVNALEESWPLFLDQCMLIDLLRARDEISFITAYGSARTGGDALDRIMERAGWQAPSKQKQAELKEYLDGLSEEEYAEWQRAQFEGIRKDMMKAGMPVAGLGNS